MNPSFTLKCSSLTRALHTQIEISTPKVSSTGHVDDSGVKYFTGLWDTGATNCCVSPAVVKELGLIATGNTQVSHANGVSVRNTYLVGVFLPNKVAIGVLQVIEADLNGFDVLIGMDVITQGDFSITNHHAKTCLSFRMPSCHEIDYAKHPEKRFSSEVAAGIRGNNFTPKKKKRK